MNYEETNKELLKIQKQWAEELVYPYIKIETNEKICLPFSFGVTQKYLNCKKKIMYIGKETLGYTDLGFNCPKWEFEKNQQWTIGYTRRQQLEKNEGFKTNPSPFWRLFRLIDKRECGVCWNNINKIESLSPRNAYKLNKPFGEEQKSILQREIEIVKPDMLIFVTGKDYISSIECSFGLELGSIPIQLSSKNIIVDLSEKINIGIPVIWTYHPNYLKANEGFTKVLETLQ